MVRSIVFDTRQLYQLSRAANKMDHKWYLAQNKIFRKGFEPLVSSAKRHASWSSRIPNTIKLQGSVNRFSLVAAVAKVDTERSFSQFARAMEYGSKSGGGRRGRNGEKNRHPVYARPKDVYNQAMGGKAWPGKWTDQPVQPFFKPAIEENMDFITKQIADGVNAFVAAYLRRIKV